MTTRNGLPCARGARIRCILSFTGVLLAGLFGLPGISAASSIAGTPHDLSGQGARAGNEICAYCHTPKSGNQPNAALWAQDTTAAEGFTLFGIQADDLPASTPFMPPPRGVSMVCLSCHDGVTAWDALFANPRVSTAGARPAAALMVGSLARDHPVSVAYPPDHDPGVRFPVRRRAGGLPLFRDFSNGADSNRVECASCHNPHGGTMRKFLRTSLRGSGLCYNCHIK